jgi:hypothetical protein
MHLQKNKHLKIKESHIPNAGKGLFAVDPKKQAGQTVFKMNEMIIPYNGESVTAERLDRRYGNKTAPYGIQDPYRKRFIEDGACKRGVGSLANHRAGGKAKIAMRNHKYVLIAKQRITNGEEIKVDYGNRYHMNEGTNYVTKQKYARRRNRRQG